MMAKRAEFEISAGLQELAQQFEEWRSSHSGRRPIPEARWIRAADMAREHQVGGSSSHKLPDWRWMEEDLISDIQILNRTFPGGRPTPSGKHHKWDKLFIRVKPAEKASK